jgi:hypothetical protein
VTLPTPELSKRTLSILKAESALYLSARLLNLRRQRPGRKAECLRLWNGSLIDASNVYGYSMAQTVVQVLRQCADELTHDNVMRQAANLQAFELPMLLPGIKINTSPTDYFPIKQMQMARFDGKAWALMGNLINQH